MITASNTYSETILDLTCPTCHKKNEVGLLKFLDANNRHNAIICIDCKNGFYVEVKFLTRAAEHRNEAEIEQPCPMCDGEGYNRDSGRVVWCEVCYGTGQV